MAISWMKKGVDSAKEVEKAEQEAKTKQEQNKQMWRFYLKDGESAAITFVDGNLTPEGVLDIMTYREHNMFMNGSWQNWFVCTSDVEPCPICESNDDNYLAGVLTIIDHRVSKSKSGDKTYKDQKRLFVCKRETIKLLQQMAVKRGGLAGCRFEVTRTGSMSPAVGSHFDFEEKTPVSELEAKYTFKDADGKTHTLFKAADYEKELNYRDADTLRKLGFGSGPAIGSEKPMTDTSGAADYNKDL